MRKSFITLGLLASCAVIAMPAEAATRVFTGVSEAVGNPDTGDIEHYTIGFSYDDSVAPIVTDSVTNDGSNIAYQTGYYLNVASISIAGPRYTVSFDTGYSRTSTLDTSQAQHGTSGFSVFGGADGSEPGYFLQFNYLYPLGGAPSNVAMPTSLDIASANSVGFDISEYFLNVDPDDPDDPGFIDQRDLLNFRVASGGFAQAAAVPEPAAWAMFIGGFGLMGSALRRRKVAVSFA